MAVTKFERVKDFYDRDLWPIDWVKDAVAQGWISEDDFKEITGEDYVGAES